MLGYESLGLSQQQHNVCGNLCSVPYPLLGPCRVCEFLAYLEPWIRTSTRFSSVVLDTVDQEMFSRKTKVGLSNFQPFHIDNHYQYDAEIITLFSEGLRDFKTCTTS